MPIQINEIRISVEVNASNETPTGQSSPSPSTDAIMKGMREMVKMIKEKNER
ncbi:DUF5908 family protein [Algoriphagus mannitolivorans]|uniref:DUF5908 family protein n=1 Tax=Algoriphagus mannitolivorans TaxID=226504 RepID=UPI0004277EB9|nr:DUF5908 family protein [Algoriphagus mannitolivorans]